MHSAEAVRWRSCCCSQHRPLRAERIKDMAQVQGVRTNQLVGYGLVVGLDGTGDQTSQAPFTIQSLDQHARPVRASRALERQSAAEERGGGVRACRHAGVRQAGTDHRHHRQFHRQRQEPARRLAAGDAAARARWTDLRHRAGQSDRQRLRRRGQRRLEAHGQRAELRPHSRTAPRSSGPCRRSSRRAMRSSSISTTPTSRPRRAWWRASTKASATAPPPSSTAGPCGCARRSMSRSASPSSRRSRISRSSRRAPRPG